MLSDNTESYNDRVKVLFDKAYELMSSTDGDINELQSVISQCNFTYSKMEAALLQETDSQKFADSLGTIEAQHKLKAELDTRVSHWLKCKGVTQQEIDDFLYVPKTLCTSNTLLSSAISTHNVNRPKSTSGSTHCKSNSGSSSSYASKSNASNNALAVANAEKARLKLKSIWKTSPSSKRRGCPKTEIRDVADFAGT